MRPTLNLAFFRPSLDGSVFEMNDQPSQAIMRASFALGQFQATAPNLPMHSYRTSNDRQHPDDCLRPCSHVGSREIGEQAELIHLRELSAGDVQAFRDSQRNVYRKPLQHNVEC